jgi:uncharacterized membrane protein HdeD (DUF308 family)/alpha-beta hydrolase superfamily lysophospholipase
VSIVVGATLISRPFQSLTVLILLVAAGLILNGVSELLDRSANDTRPTTAIGIGWIGLGLIVLLWPGVSLRLLAIVVGIALIAGGVARVLAGLRGDDDERIAAILLGAAGVILGLTALFWPDVTLLVVAVVFGAQLIFFGIARLSSLFRQANSAPDGKPARPGGPFGRFVRTTGAALALLVALGLALVSLRLNAGAPVADAFYSPPAQLPAEPGVLLRSEPMDRALPAGAQAWRILYTTTRSDGSPALASGLVVAPQNLPAGPRPVIAWAHGTTGVNETCAPSVLADPFTSGAAPALDQVIANGWILVGTDYIGLGTQGPHGYLVGAEGGRAVLDAVRAARQLTALQLADTMVVWGHSQGGGVALWTGILAPEYAPDVPLAGVAALAPASELPSMIGNLDVMPGGPVFAAYVIQGYSDTYADVNFADYVRPTAHVQVREIASRCLAEPSIFVSIVETLVFDRSIWSRDPTMGPFGERLRENVPTGPMPAPLLLAQGLADPLVLPAAQEAYAAARCAMGGQVDYRTYAGRGHVEVIDPDSPLIPELIAWTQARFDGQPAGSTCG